ncbi:LysR family transcriptional regulator [Endozoicomonas sp. ALB115]|uniref:LysR family transcriptional regulator n=1 Tax=Endozoicomonas sp. ALB115 TaxID=3403074 RepID=UPI003BB54444
MNLETKWLEDFLALAELRNFSRAAQHRNVTQPAFSRRIRSLEHALGVELIDRTTTPLALTPEGRLFHTTARNLLRQMDDGVQPLFRLSGQLGSIPLLGYSPGAFMGRQVNGLLRKIDNLPRFQPVMESSLTNLLKVMALKGGGIAWLPGYAIVDELASGQLVDFAGLDQREKYWGSIEIKLYRNDVRLHAGAERFWSALGKRCQQGWLLT